MPRPPAVRVLAAAVLCASAVPAVSACGSGQAGQAAGASPSAAAATRPAGPVSPDPAALTAAQAQAALLTEDDLGATWRPSEGVATWRDGIIKARTTAAPDCRRLLDALYADQPLGAPKGTYAVTGFDDGDGAAQLRQQVLSPRPADVDRSLAWLRTLPKTCARFTATTTRAGVQTVRVSDLAMPAAGDARQGLRITFTGPPDGSGSGSGGADVTTLSVDVVAVRVGGDAFALTDGAPGTLPSGATDAAVRRGVERLRAVRSSGRAQA
ncbi:hypothetical protein [Streptomyces sp. NPDC056160]|uniref:hypothetical protein n=1 Tax=Streptomyces sp. NPDC056160 TaxID=3345731 RepID=UPI0035DD1204